MSKYIRLLRPHQWPKQSIVIVPILSLGHAIDLIGILYGLASIITFTLIASTIYILNDLFDIEEDKLDLIRKQRPLASGTVSKHAAIILLINLSLSAFILNYLFSQNHFITLGLMISYLILNVFYSRYKLKNHGVLGICFVASGFPLRFAFGCFFLAIPISYWAIVLLMELALFMLSVKRYQRTLRKNYDMTQTGNHEFWLLSAVIFAAFFSASYAGFISAPATQQIWGTNALLLSAIPMSLAIVRFLELATKFSNWSNRDVTDSVFKDVPLVSLAFIYMAIMLLGSLTHG
jgi:decaprenyl-phosphate phosphoribosyltransferase